MAKAGKKYKAAAAQVDREKQYTTDEAVKLVKGTSFTKFDGTVECHIRLGVDPRQADQQVRGVVVLPNGLGKTVRILVFAQGEGARIAREAGADIVADTDEWIKRIQDGFTEFDVAIATPDMMGKVGRLGRVLGPRGLMPNPKTGTVTPDVTRAVKDAKGGKIEFRVEKAGIIHAPVGKASFPAEKLQDNFNTLIDLVMKLKPATAKGIYLKGIAISTTMGPGIKLDTQEIVARHR